MHLTKWYLKFLLNYLGIHRANLHDNVINTRNQQQDDDIKIPINNASHITPFLVGLLLSLRFSIQTVRSRRIESRMGIPNSSRGVFEGRAWVRRYEVPNDRMRGQTLQFEHLRIHFQQK